MSPYIVDAQTAVVRPTVAAVEVGIINSGCATTCGDPPMATTGRELPSHLIRDRVDRRQVPGDPISQRIARLLRENPELNDDYRYVNLVTMSPQARRYMLASINRRFKSKAMV